MRSVPTTFTITNGMNQMNGMNQIEDVGGHIPTIGVPIVRGTAVSAVQQNSQRFGVPSTIRSYPNVIQPPMTPNGSNATGSGGNPIFAALNFNHIDFRTNSKVMKDATSPHGLNSVASTSSTTSMPNTMPNFSVNTIPKHQSPQKVDSKTGRTMVPPMSNGPHFTMDNATINVNGAPQSMVTFLNDVVNTCNTLQTRVDSLESIIGRMSPRVGSRNVLSNPPLGESSHLNSLPISGVTNPNVQFVNVMNGGNPNTMTLNPIQLHPFRLAVPLQQQQQATVWCNSVIH